MSSTLSSLHDIIDVSSTNALIEEVTMFISYVLPPMLCYVLCDGSVNHHARDADYLNCMVPSHDNISAACSSPCGYVTQDHGVKIPSLCSSKHPFLHQPLPIMSTSSGCSLSQLVLLVGH